MTHVHVQLGHSVHYLGPRLSCHQHIPAAVGVAGCVHARLGDGARQGWQAASVQDVWFGRLGSPARLKRRQGLKF